MDKKSRDCNSNTGFLSSRSKRLNHIHTRISILAYHESSLREMWRPQDQKKYSTRADFTSQKLKLMRKYIMGGRNLYDSI